MKIRFLGAARTVTGSFYVIETGQTRFAVDCGLFQGSKELKERNYKDFSVDPKSIDFMVLTHAHIDHSGLIPKLCRLGFTGPIYCNYATSDLCQVLLPDSGYIQESEVERKNRKNLRAGHELIEAIYTADDAVNALKQLRPVDYDELVQVSPEIELRLRDAGHILGSSIVELWLQENGRKIKLVFSGDLGQGNQPIIKDPTIIESADYLFMESTYGDRYHQGTTNRIDQFEQIIKEAMSKGGNLVIPAFAVERTQDLLYDLNVLYHDGRLDPGIDIYIDSPLAIAATEIFQRSVEYYDDETRRYLESGNHPLKLPNLKYSRSQEDSMQLNLVKNNTIIISASGMCDAGRIKHHLKHNLWRAESTILFVGYQAIGTLGRRLLDGEKLVTIHGEEVAVKADIKRIEAYSAHADQGGLLSWVKQFDIPPKTIFLVHGEEASQQALADLIKKELNIPVVVPGWLDEFELQAGDERQKFMLKEEQDVSKSILAEELYLNLRTRLNQLFKDASTEGQYDELIAKLKELDSRVADLL